MAIRKSVGVAKVLERATARLAGRPQTGAAELMMGANKVAGLLSGLEDIAERRNPTETREAHALRVSKAAERLLGELDAAVARANNARIMATTAIQARLDDATKLADGPRGREIRDHVRSLPAPERAALIESAMQARDAETLGALFMAPHYLAGFSPDQQETFRRHYEASVAPEVVAEFDDVLAADEAAAVVRRVAREAATEARQPDYVARIEKDRAAAEAAQASFDAQA